VATARGGVAGRVAALIKSYAEGKRLLTDCRYGSDRMTPAKKDKPAGNRFGYGALALYALGIVVVAVGVYGINVSSLVARLHETERMREQIRSGRMVVVTGDREQCRTYHFDNVTADVTAEKMVDCENVITPDGRGGHGSGFNIFQRGFQSR
jgi:hypothetical protein